MSILENACHAYPEIAPESMSAIYEEMRKCKAIYKNEAEWNEVKKSGLYARGERKMSTLNAAKALCDEFSTLTFSEQVEITINDDNVQEYVMKVLEKNGFWENIPEFLSVTYAIGGGVLKVFADDKEPCIDYVVADNFAPTSWTGKSVTEGIFQTLTVKNKKKYTLLEHHYKDKSNSCVEYKLYESDSQYDIGKEVTLGTIYSDMPELVKYNTPTPMFSYFRPAVSNNVDIGSPLGISVFSNAKDTLKALDIAFDSFSREFILGKKRIIVPSSCIRTVVNVETGESERYFDADDEAYVALLCEDEKDLKITDNTIELRIEEHVSAINALLNILCFQTGLSSGTLSFSGSEGVKTATEVISRDSKTARTIKSNKNLLVEAFESLIHSIIAIGIYYGDIADREYEITIGFQDNIIVDDDTLIDRNIKLVEGGLKSKLKAIMEVQKCDEETAQKELERIAKEQSVTGLAVDDMMGNNEGGEADDETGDNAVK